MPSYCSYEVVGNHMTICRHPGDWKEGRLPMRGLTAEEKAIELVVQDVLWMRPPHPANVI